MEAEERAEQAAENYQNEADLLNSHPGNNPGNVWMIQNPGTSAVDYIPVNLTHIKNQVTITARNTSHLERTAYLICAQNEYSKQPEGCWDCGATGDNTSMRWDAAVLEMRDSYQLRVSCDKCEHEAVWDV